ncbi:hypothetical protein UWK_02343 [Desulfocapsa sulfexigens DSM 10523]|uniref:Lipoprotein n=1 Tax=Desulfocapsa sulfexigens (strain DSM 10523 / SB164P1) TaxID=1167006 RepID=M1P5Y5_DESSD|nr:hypothetical protein [Desulfocapsa sulfexigens]AGF78883.1 hypothetical protein UWK_02343 [Desulfocapsa sulfexigens DSM 10523]
MRVVSILLLVFFLCSCSRIPQPASYAYSEQQKMQAAHHWDVLASDVANQINNRLIITDFVDKAVYVKTTCGDDASPCEQGQTTQFNEGFRDLLITRLVNFGVPTSLEKKVSDIEVNYKVQVVYHASNRYTLPPGTLSVITAAISVLRHAPSTIQMLALAAGIDIANSAGPVNGHYEVIITTSMVADEQYLFRTSDIYYINDPDFWHYQNAPTGKTIQMVSTIQ